MISNFKKVLGIGLVGCLVSGSGYVLAASSDLPEVPAIVRDVHMSENDHYTRPTLPPTQTSADSRIGLSHKGFDMYFRLHVPEKINTSYINSETGTHIYSTGNAKPLEAARLKIANTYISGGQLGLCDPSFDPQSNIKNPRVCDKDDCYDMAVVGFAEEIQNGETVKRVTSTAVTVRVSQPKTVNAKITQVSVGETILGSALPLKDMVFETMVVGQGRLLVARTDSTIPWINSKGQSLVSDVNPIYFVNNNPDNFEPCDARQWNKVYPLSHAPYDNTINKRYGFAMQPFKDTLGNVIAENTTFWGSYPWMDKNADNFSITTYGKSLLKEGVIKDDFAVRCAVQNCSPDEEIGEGGNKGRVFMGLWTHGKMVHLDGLINHLDYGLRSKDRYQRDVQFYQPTDGHDGFIRIGNGRENALDLSPLGSAGNTDFLDSIEHRFNYFKHMRPVKPADVVWLMSSGSASEEVSFDDYTNVNTFINANMTFALSVSNDPNRARGLRGMVKHTDRFQNAATSPLWNLPAYGQIINGGRVEETANGGINGRGYWLDGKGAGLTFDIASQPRSVTDNDWYYGIFVDTRYDSAQDKTLLSFPDGSQIKVKEDSALLLIDSTGSLRAQINVNAHMQRKQWVHFGFQMVNSGTKIKTFVNGMQVHTYNTNSPILQLVPGQLTLGVNPKNSSDNFKGWIDDFKVFADHLDPETACNQANGTLVALTDSSSNTIKEQADLIPEYVHDMMTDRLKGVGKPSYSQYVCMHDHTGDNQIHLGNLPQSVISIRNSIHFPEGPILYDAPRPNSINNKFCLMCHTVEGKQGLDLDALRLQSNVLAIDDPRRQPMQPEPFVYGVIPQNWLGLGLPAQMTMADANTGFAIDKLVLGSRANPLSAVAAVLGRIEAEDYDKQWGIQTESTKDIGGGENVGWIENGNWTEYDVAIPSSGIFTFSARVATESAGGFLDVLSDGHLLMTVEVRNTQNPGWQNWFNVNHNIQLKAGQQSLRLRYRGSSGFLFNLNWFEIK
ncbi:MAG: carbohydrate-binding protein [Pseudomonadota bacterium]